MAGARVRFRTDAFMREKTAQLGQAMRAVALEGERIAKTDVLNQPGQGEPFVRYGPGGRRVGIASRPGDTPAPDTGGLRNRTSSETIHERDAVIARTSINSEHAILLDEGTEKMAPRPFREPIRNKMLGFFKRAARLYLSR